jgi:hypothetical protein
MIQELRDTYPLIAHRVDNTPAEELGKALQKALRMQPGVKGLKEELLNITVTLLKDRMERSA